MDIVLVSFETSVCSTCNVQGFINIKSVLDGEKGKRFTYPDVGNRDSNWAHEKEPWAYGYW